MLNETSIHTLFMFIMFAFTANNWYEMASHLPFYTWLRSTKTTQIAKFMGPTWGPPGSCRPQMGPILAPWNIAIRENMYGFPGHLYLRKITSKEQGPVGVRYNTEVWHHTDGSDVCTSKCHVLGSFIYCLWFSAGIDKKERHKWSMNYKRVDLTIA